MKLKQTNSRLGSLKFTGYQETPGGIFDKFWDFIFKGVLERRKRLQENGEDANLRGLIPQLDLGLRALKLLLPQKQL